MSLPGLDDILTAVRKGSRFLVTCHRGPDGDALGSALGLAAILRAIDKQVVVFAPEPIPMPLRFMPGASDVARTIAENERFDATFVLDIAARSLLPTGLPPRARSGPVIVIDHHSTHDDVGDLVIRDVSASATGEIVIRLARALGVDRLSQAAAVPLYASIVADTGGFRYPSTRSSTLRLAADLLDAGVDPWEVAYNLFEGWDRAKLSLLGDVLSTLELHHDGKLATLRVTRAMIQRVSATDDMVEGLVNYGRSLRGVEVAALVWERVADVGAPPVTKVSLRSRGVIDVAAVAVKFGGGGHTAAAAALVNEPIDAVMSRVVREVAIALAG